MLPLASLLWRHGDKVCAQQFKHLLSGDLCNLRRRIGARYLRSRDEHDSRKRKRNDQPQPYIVDLLSPLPPERAM
jgi:hypothetical protein